MWLRTIFAIRYGTRWADRAAAKYIVRSNCISIRTQRSRIELIMRAMADVDTAGA